MKEKMRKKDGCCQVVDLTLQKKSQGFDIVVYLNNKRYTRRKTEKKMGLTELWIRNYARN